MPSRKIIIAISLVAGMVAACGKVDLVQVDATGNGGSRSTGPSLNRNPVVVVSPTPAPAPSYNPPLQMGKFTTSLKFEDDPWYTMGLGTKKAHVEVSNPTTVPLRGTIKVEFTRKGAPVEGKEAQTSELLELAPGEKRTLTFAEKGIGIDNARVTVQMEGETTGGSPVPSVPGAGTAGTGGGGASVYGMPPGMGR